MFFRINEFAKLIDVHPNTVRRWEHEGKLKPNHRTAGNQRVYSDKQVSDYLKRKKELHGSRTN